MSAVISLPLRSEVNIEDTWDLDGLFASDESWEEGLEQLESRISGYEEFRGKLGDGPSFLAACLAWDSDTQQLPTGWPTMRF